MIVVWLALFKVHSAEAWTDLSTALGGTKANTRGEHGFTSAGGKLYVHGGSVDLVGFSKYTNFHSYDLCNAGTYYDEGEALCASPLALTKAC